MWIITSWQCMSSAVIVKGCKKCCISNALDETEFDMLWNGSAEDGDVRCGGQEDEGTDCEDGQSGTDW